MDPITLDRPLPTKIAIVGFADSKDEAPYDDPSWEMWGVNDIYAHVKRIDRSFELHADWQTRIQFGTRNPGYETWMREGKTPVYVWDPKPEYPSSIQFPSNQVTEAFGDYFTNSISWMTALALLVLTEVKESGRVARPDVKLGLWGVDMAHETEYGAQRPSCEYYVGIARALGIETIIPATSDLLKAGSLYGIETTSPQRIKMEKRIATLTANLNQLNAQRQNAQMQIAALEAQMNQIKGAVGAFKYVRGVWTMGTDVIDPTKGHAREVTPADGQVTLHVDANGAVDMESLLSQMDVQEAKSG